MKYMRTIARDCISGTKNTLDYLTDRNIKVRKGKFLLGVRY